MPAPFVSDVTSLDAAAHSQAAVIIDSYNRSGSSTDPAARVPEVWRYRRRWLLSDDNTSEPQEEPKRTLLDDEYSTRASEITKLFNELATKQEEARAAERRMRQRISFLKSEAESERDPFNTASERDFWRFMDSHAFLNQPKVFLLNNGNLRALWQGQADQQIGAQFLGRGAIQYVIFARRDDAPEVSRVAGRDSVKGFMRQITALEIGRLIFA